MGASTPSAAARSVARQALPARRSRAARAIAARAAIERMHTPSLWLALIVAVGLTLRLWGLSFGLPQLYCRPDETTLVNKALSIAAGDPNPHFFNYPSLHLYSLAVVYGGFFALGWLSGHFAGIEAFQRFFFTDPSAFILIGRAGSAVLGTVSIGLVYSIGRRLGGVPTGLYSALFLSVAFLHVRDSHFLTVDVPATAYMLAGYVLLLRHLERRRAVDLYAGALFFGLAASTKYNVGLLAISALVTAIATAGDRRMRWTRLTTVIGITGMAFLAGTPYALLDFSSFWRDLSYERLHFAVGHGDPVIDLGRGWSYHLRFTLPHGLGWPLLATAWAGIGVMAWRRRAVDLVLLSGLLLYYVVAGSGRGVFMRYMLPLVPLLCAAAGLVCALVQRRWGRPWALLLAGLLVVPTASTVWQFNHLLSRPDTRLLAARWIAAEIPDGSPLALHGSAFGHPQVRRSREWMQVELEDIRAAGLDGRRLAAMLSLEDFPPPPSYFPIELRSTDALPRRTVWRSYDLERLRAAGVDWIVTHRHPLTGLPAADDFIRQLEQQATLVQHFDPFKDGWQGLSYDRLDFFYVPVAGFAGLHRTGPEIRLYRLP